MRSLEFIRKARTLQVRDAETEDGMDVSIAILPDRYIEVTAQKVFGGVASKTDTIHAVLSYATAQAYLGLLSETLDQIDDEYSKKYGLREIEDEKAVEYPALQVKVVGFVGD